MDLLQPEKGNMFKQTYHGTMMNQSSLSFHTQLYEWNEAQNISASTNKHVQAIIAANQKEAYLPVKKLVGIEYWTRQVNKYYLPSSRGRPKSTSFMKIDVSKYNIKLEKHQHVRSISAIYPYRFQINNVVSKATAGTHSAGSRSTTGTQRRFFGTDVLTINNNLIDSQMHYSAQRKNIYSEKCFRSVKTSKADDIKVDAIPGNEKSHNTDQSDTESVTIPEDSSNTPEIESLSLGQGQIKKCILQPEIVSRSYSNRMLNVISIDDCKLSCRYRPQMIKENQKVSDDYCKNTNSAKSVTETPVYIDNTNDAERETVNENETDDKNGCNTETMDDISNTLNDVSIGKTQLDTNCNSDHVANHNNETCYKLEKNVDTEKPLLNYENTVRNDNKFSISPLYIKTVEKEKKNGNDQNVMYDLKTTSSIDTSNASYGRVTNLYTYSNSSNKNDKKKKISQTSLINNAINDLVKDRRVMNSLDRDFDSRTTQYGRTIIENTQGSETFKKLHANLRKNIDSLIEKHRVRKTKIFYERKQQNGKASTQK